MPKTDRVPMFHPCYRIHDHVEVRPDNPQYTRSLPRAAKQYPLRRFASWLRGVMRTGKRRHRQRSSFAVQAL